jgi:hypothetical protein
MNFFGIAAGAYLTPLLSRLKEHDVPLSTGFAFCAILSVGLSVKLKKSLARTGHPVPVIFCGGSFHNCLWTDCKTNIKIIIYVFLSLPLFGKLLCRHGNLHNASGICD